jgi:hypothetical protein
MNISAIILYTRDSKAEYILFWDFGKVLTRSRASPSQEKNNPAGIRHKTINVAVTIAYCQPYNGKKDAYGDCFLDLMSFTIIGLLVGQP